MAPRGQKPKPTHLKLIMGNPGKRPLPKNEPRPELAIPTAPVELSEDAKLEWARVTVDLHRMGLLTNIDRAALVAYCDSWGILVRTRRLLAKLGEDGADGLLIKTQQGNFIQSPLLSIINRAKRDVVAFAEQFGMTPSARARVNGSGASETTADPVNKYFKV